MHVFTCDWFQILLTYFQSREIILKPITCCYQLPTDSVWSQHIYQRISKRNKIKTRERCEKKHKIIWMILKNSNSKFSSPVQFAIRKKYNMVASLLCNENMAYWSKYTRLRVRKLLATNVDLFYTFSLKADRFHPI